MALITITPTDVTLATRTDDLVGSGTSVVAGNTFEWAGSADAGFRYLVLLEEVGGGAATVTFDAGDLPPAHRQGLGSLAITLAASDLRALVIEGARHMQDDGKITGSVATNNCRIRVLKLPHTY